jgi:hypothetical protein
MQIASGFRWRLSAFLRRVGDILDTVVVGLASNDA